MEVQKQFCEAFGLIDNFTESKQYLETNNITPSKDMLQFMEDWCVQLQREGEFIKMLNVAHQHTVLNKCLLKSSDHFFDKVNTDPCYRMSFNKDVCDLRTKIELEAAAQMLKEGEDEMKKFGFCALNESETFLTNHVQLVSVKTLKFLRDWCLTLAKEGKNDEMERIAYQYVCLKSIVDENNDIDPNQRVKNFYGKMNISHFDEMLRVDEAYKHFMDTVKAEQLQSEPGLLKYFCRRYWMVVS